VSGPGGARGCPPAGHAQKAPGGAGPRPRCRAPGVAVASPGTARTPRDLRATWGQRPAAGRRALRSGKRRCWCGVPGAGGPCGAGSPRGPQVAEAEKTPRGGTCGQRKTLVQGSGGTTKCDGMWVLAVVRGPQVLRPCARPLTLHPLPWERVATTLL